MLPAQIKPKLFESRGNSDGQKGPLQWPNQFWQSLEEGARKWWRLPPHEPHKHDDAITQSHKQGTTITHTNKEPPSLNHTNIMTPSLSQPNAERPALSHANRDLLSFSHTNMEPYSFNQTNMKEDSYWKLRWSNYYYQLPHPYLQWPCIITQTTDLNHAETAAKSDVHSSTVSQVRIQNLEARRCTRLQHKGTGCALPKLSLNCTIQRDRVCFAKALPELDKVFFAKNSPWTVQIRRTGCTLPKGRGMHCQNSPWTVQKRWPDTPKWDSHERWDMGVWSWIPQIGPEYGWAT